MSFFSSANSAAAFIAAFWLAMNCSDSVVSFCASCLEKRLHTGLILRADIELAAE
jgi:hypothetical protein